MKQYTASQARQHLSSVLDAAEKGEDVTIVRKGRHFLVRAELERHTTRRKRRRSVFAFVDPAIEAGCWRWAWDAERGLTFEEE